MMFEYTSQPADQLPSGGGADDGVESTVKESEYNQGNNAVMTEDERSRLKYIKRRRYVIEELLYTERTYIDDLAQIVEGYLIKIQNKEVTLPQSLEGREMVVFGNVHQIYDWHKDTFQKEMERNAENAQRLGRIFVNYERRLHMYVKYCENKPKSESLVIEFIDFFEDIRQQLGHRLALPDMLIKPVQRIMKYQLLLKEVLKHTERAGEDTRDLQRALDVMCVIPRAANDMMNAGRLHGFEGKLTAQGKLLMQDNLQVAAITGQSKSDKVSFFERRVFLFEQVVIFSEEVIDKKNPDLSTAEYCCKHYLRINNMTMEEVISDFPLRFLLIGKMPSSNLRVICQAPNEEMKQNWITLIRSLLDMQGDIIRALTSPIAYQKELSKELSTPDVGSIQSNSGGNNSREKHSKVVSKSVGEKKHITPKSTSNNSPSPVFAPPPGLIITLDISGRPALLGASGAIASKSPKPKRSFLGGIKLTLRGGRGSDVSNSKQCRNKDHDSDNDVTDGAINLPPSETTTCAVEELSGGGGGGVEGITNCSSQRSSDESSPSSRSGAWARVTEDYNATSDNELTISKGEVVKIIGYSGSMCLISRQTSKSSNDSPGFGKTSGLVPSLILVQKDVSDCGNSRKLWHLRFKRPSFRIDKDKRNKEAKSSLDGSIGPVKEWDEFDQLEETAQPILSRMSDVQVETGGTAVFTCRVRGKPRPSVSWLDPSRTAVANSSKIFSEYSDEDGVARLKLSSVSQEMSGEYSCIATNEFGAVVSTSRLIVLFASTPLSDASTSSDCCDDSEPSRQFT